MDRERRTDSQTATNSAVRIHRQACILHAVAFPYSFHRLECQFDYLTSRHVQNV